MKTGRSIVELAQELQRQSETKRDFIADSRELVMLNGRELRIPGVDRNGGAEFGIRPLAHRQISEYTGIPAQYYDRLRESHPELLDTNVNTLLRAQPKPRLVRTLDGQVRAFLSNGYRRIDNIDLANSIFPMLQRVGGLEFPSMDVTESRLYIHVVNPRLTGEVTVGQEVQGGVLIKNSEVGLGYCEVGQLIYTLACKNGAVTEYVVRQMHSGRRITIEESAAYEIYRDETLKADDQAFFLKIRDMVEAAMTEVQFRRVLTKLQLAAQSRPIENVSAGVKDVTKRFALTEGEGESVLQYLAKGGDLSKWGLSSAITRAAQDVQSYDRSVELQELGGRVIELDPKVWGEIVSAKEAVAA